MKFRITWLATTLLACALGAGTASDLPAQESFFRGKQVRIVVGLSSGGGYDRAARLLGRYIGKYIPGNPDVLVQNMPGAS